MISIVYLAVIALTSSSCFALTDDQSAQIVSRECNRKLRDIDSIDKFENFMEHYRIHIKSVEKPKRGILNLEARIRKCYDLEDRLLELEKIVADRHQGICRMEYIERLVDFHLKYLADDNNNSEHEDKDDAEPERKRQPGASFISFFFSIFTHQVAFNCKLKLTERVKDAQQHQDCSSVLVKFLPQIFDPPKDTDMAETANFLKGFKRVENFAPIPKFTKITSPDAYYDVIIPDAAFDKVVELKRRCRQREPFYTAMFSPVATLAQLGYIIDEAKSDSDDIEDKETRLLKCWLATAQLCQGILRTHLTLNKDLVLDEELKSKFVSIKWGATPIDNGDKLEPGPTINYVDSFQEISPHVIKLVKKKFTNVGKIKRKALSWSKSFIERHINTEAIQKAAGRRFVDAMTEVNNEHDSPVAFSGQKFDNKKFNPISIVTDDADTLVKLTSPFWNKEIGLMVSCIIGIVMSAVFVWFSIYALATTIKQHVSTKDESNFKSDWLRMRDEEVKKIKDKFEKGDKKGVLNVYKPA